MKRCRKCSKRNIIRIAAGLMAALFLVGCGSKEPVVEPEITELTLWYYWDVSATRERLLELISDFNRNQDTINITAKYIPDEDFKKTLALAIADGEMPDMAIVDSSDVRYYEDMIDLMDVSEYVDREEYWDAALKPCANENEIIGVPLGLNCLCLYYNKTLFAEKGLTVPTNMDEFVETARKLTSDSVYGCAFPSLQSEETVFCFLPILWAEGGKLAELDSEAGYAAFNRLRQIVKSRGMNSLTANMTLSDISLEFAKGNIGMIFSTTMRENQFQKENSTLDLGVAELPTNGISVVGGEILTVLGTEHREETKLFLEYMTEPDLMKTYLEDMMYLAPRKDILQWQMEGDPERAYCLEYLANARVRDFTPYWPSVSLAVADSINQIILEKDEPDLVETLAKKIDKIREEYRDKN